MDLSSATTVPPVGRPAPGLVRMLAVVVPALGLISCHETTAPRFAVALRASQSQPPTIATDGRGLPTVACHISLEATTTGSGQAAWGGAVAYFFAINNRSTPIDSVTVPDTTVQSSWGSRTIATSPEESGWSVSAGIPFAVTFKYRYRVVGGGADSTQATAVCSPAVVQGPAPTFTVLATDSSSLLQPGGRLAVHYTVTSSVGLWVTILSVTGPCDTTVAVGEPLQQTDTRTLTVPLSGTCSLGVPLTVQITAYDALLQSTSRAAILPALVDTVAPTVEILIGPRFGGAYTNDLQGEWFGDDSILIMFIAQDNSVVRSLNWEVQPQGFRDSAVVNAVGGISEPVAIPVLQGWDGPVQLRFYARDAAGNTSDTVQSVPGAIYVAPTIYADPGAGTANVSGGVEAWDVRRKQLYLYHGNAKMIDVFSRTANAVTGTIQLSEYPVSFDLTPGGDTLVVAEGPAPSLAFVDLRTTPPTASEVPVSGVDTTMSLVALVAAANGKVLLTAANSAAGTGHAYAYDLSSNSLQLRADAGINGQTGNGTMVGSYDRSVVVLNGGPGMFQRYDTAGDAFGPPTTARGDGTLAVDGNGTHVTVGGALYDSTLQYVLTPQGLHYIYQPIVLSPDGSTIYFSYGNAGNVRYRTSDGTPIDHVQYPLTVNLLTMSPDGKTLAVLAEELNANVLGLVTVPPTAGAVARPAVAAVASSARPTPGERQARDGRAGIGRRTGGAWAVPRVLSTAGAKAGVAGLRLLARPTLQAAHTASR